MMLFFDLETVPDQSPAALDKYLAEVKPPGQYKKPESIDQWMRDNAEAQAVENWKRTALEGISGQIVSISWAWKNDEVRGCIATPDSSEKLVLQEFFDACHDYHRTGEGHYQHIEWVGHNIIDFDLRFLYQRAVVNDLRPSFMIPTESRHGSKNVYDNMKAWAGYRGYVSQDALWEALGLGEPEEVDGSMVWDMIQAGRYDEVLAYNKRDVTKVREIYKRLTWAK